MKQKTKIILSMFIFTVVVSALVVGLIMPGILQNIRNKGDDGVYIRSDADLIGFPGNGTLENPYIIENLELNPSGSTTNRIDISGTTKHIIIRNCIIQDVRCFVDCYPFAIDLEFINEGSIMIYNNTIRSSHGGIAMSFVNNVNITNNLIIDCDISISTLRCFYLIVEKNSLINCGSMDTDIHYSEIKENYFCETGLSVTSYNCNYSRNIFENCSIRISYFHEIEISNNSFEENIVNGRVFGYFSNSENLNINNTIYGQLVLIDCSSVVISNQTLSDAHFGIFLFQCNNVNIVNCTFLDDLGKGIFCDESNSIIISFCEFNGCYRSIRIEWGYNITVVYNRINMSEYEGLYLDSNYSIVHHNSFISNYIQAVDFSVDSLWYDSISLEGNFWSDWSGTGVYHISGSANALDPYPLSEPPV